MKNIIKVLLSTLIGVILSACGDASHVMEPNTYWKCSEYSIQRQRTVKHSLDSGTTTEDTTYVMTYEGRKVVLTDDQAKRLDTDPTGVCKEVM